jgi:hypothetical protein
MQAAGRSLRKGKAVTCGHILASILGYTRGYPCDTEKRDNLASLFQLALSGKAVPDKSECAPPPPPADLLLTSGHGHSRDCS